MSFQDIGRRGGHPSASSSSSYRPQQQSAYQTSTSTSTSSSLSAQYKNNGGSAVATGAVLVQPVGMNDGENREYSAISQAILQYQQNINIFANIVQNIGTTKSPYDSQILKQQYNAQSEVIHELSSKVQLHLDQIEKQKLSERNSNNNTNQYQLQRQQQHRAQHSKLTRDFKWVETKFNNVRLEGERKWKMEEMERRRILEDEEQRRKMEDDLDHHDSQRLRQMQLADDRVVQEIMREREEELSNINRGMHQVNAIYKDLATIIGAQQEQIDEVEVTMEQANKSSEAGLKQIEKAHAKSMENKCIIS